MSDPTMQLVRRLKNPAAWAKVVQGVPIFVPHEREGPDGELVQVDRQRLEKIARRINLRYQRKGVPLIFTEGHRYKDPRTGQWKRNPVLSYGINARVGQWGPDKQWGVLADQYIPEETYAKVKDHPFRSAEFYPEDNQITSVALLRSDPALDMGVVEYEQERGCLLYSLEYAMAFNDDDDDRDDAMGDDPARNPMDDDTDDDDADDTGDDRPIEDADRQAFMRYMRECYPSLHAQHGGEPAPGSGPADHYDRTRRRPARQGRGRPRGQDADALHYERAQADLDKRLSDLEKRERLLVYERELQVLKERGYKFSMKDELADCAEFDRSRFDRHKRRIVANYARESNPATYERVPVDDSPDADEQEPSARDPHRAPPGHEEALDYLRQHPGMTYEKAIAHVRELRQQRGGNKRRR